MQLQDQSPPRTPEDLLYFLNKWLVRHVANEDLMIAEYVHNSERRPIGEELYGQYLLRHEPT